MTYDFTQLTRLGIDYDDATALRRISMTLRRWYELECGADNGCIVRDETLRWQVNAKARKRYSNGPWLSKVRFYHATTKDDATDQAERDFRKDGYELLATQTTLIESIPGKPYWLNSHTMRRSPIADRERAAERRLARIMARYPTLGYYLQGDPRGCALYILRPGDIPEGQKAESYYSRGIAVYK